MLPYQLSPVLILKKKMKEKEIAASTADEPKLKKAPSLSSLESSTSDYVASSGGIGGDKTPKKRTSTLRKVGNLFAVLTIPLVVLILVVLIAKITVCPSSSSALPVRAGENLSEFVEVNGPDVGLFTAGLSRLMAVFDEPENASTPLFGEESRRDGRDNVTYSGFGFGHGPLFRDFVEARSSGLENATKNSSIDDDEDNEVESDAFHPVSIHLDVPAVGNANGSSSSSSSSFRMMSIFRVVAGDDDEQQVDGHGGEFVVPLLPEEDPTIPRAADGGRHSSPSLSSLAASFRSKLDSLLEKIANTSAVHGLAEFFLESSVKDDEDNGGDGAEALGSDPDDGYYGYYAGDAEDDDAEAVGDDDVGGPEIETAQSQRGGQQDDAGVGAEVDERSLDYGSALSFLDLL